MNIKKLFNKNRYIPKNISYPFLIIWALVVLFFSIDTVTQIASDKDTKQKTENVQGTQTVSFQKTPPTPTVTPASTPFAQQEARKPTPQANQAGTRTGKIISYKEWCSGGKQISIYENELITKKSTDGKTYTMTQGDWDCYEKKLQTNQNKLVQGVWDNVKANAANSGYSVCIYKAKFDVDECGKKCNDTWAYYKDACAAGYTGESPLIESSTERYSECIDENSDINSQCQAKCTNDYQTALKKCSSDAGYQ
ncbi:MAG: hypothetical protein G01um10147_1082 [Microgenomates group bacterium Gr01-1014_7]|nr:MAG: hypothetical protein G01um10147_1082 [Microgenomates group bacterium Gr01-1014_7]